MSILAPFSFPTVTYGIATSSPRYRVLTDKFVNRENRTTLSCSGALFRKGTKLGAPFHRSTLQSSSLWQRRDARRTRCEPRAVVRPAFCCRRPTQRSCPGARRTPHRYRALAEGERCVRSISALDRQAFERARRSDLSSRKAGRLARRGANGNRGSGDRSCASGSFSFSHRARIHLRELRSSRRLCL